MIRYVIFWSKWLANWWSRIFVHIIIYYFKIETEPLKTSEKLVRRKGKNYKPSILRERFCVFPCSEDMRMTEYIITCLYVFTFQFIAGIKTQNGIFSQPLQNLRAKKFRKSNSKIIAFDLF